MVSPRLGTLLAVSGVDPNYTVDETLPAFRDASDWFLSVLRGIGDEQWAAPALGEWTVLELAAHASRAYSTVADYLAPHGDIDVGSAAEYFRRAMPDAAVNAAIAERGRAEARALAADPVRAIETRAADTFALIEEAPVGSVCVSRGGTIALGDYLATRVVELSVHTLDLADAVGLDHCEPPPLAAHVSVSVLGALASSPSPSVLLRALTGRVPLPRGFSVFP
jgi:uncharacterized protein (TIGR03083 family)